MTQSTLDSPPRQRPRATPTATTLIASARAPIDPLDGKFLAVLSLVLLVIYLLLQNRYWVPAGDSEFYISAARSLARGEGYRFNGMPIGSAPPGWPLMMSIVMRITPYFLPLKLLAMSCMIGSLLLGYGVVRRFVPPRQAMAVILLTGMLSYVYEATYWLISESSFCLATTASILIAMQIAEGKREKWRIALLLALCAAAASIRHAGLLNMALVVAALLDGQWKPRRSTTWIAASLVVLVTVGTFAGWRLTQRVTNDEMAEITGLPYSTAQETPTPELPPVINGAADQTAHTYQLFPRGSYADRFLNWGHWFSFLYWQPFRAAGGSARIAMVSALLGWTIIALLGGLMVAMMKHRRWIWLAIGLYSGALAFRWNVINSRYYVPIAFLITLGVFLAVEQLLSWTAQWPRFWRVAIRGGFAAFVAAVALCNLATYGVEVRIARSPDFYQRYEAGLNESMIAACQYLSALPPEQRPRDREIAVSQRYTNMGRSRSLPSPLRLAVMLSDRAIATPRFKDTAVSPELPIAKAAAVRKWLVSHGVRYYLWQPPISPWRVWHFRMAWLEKARTGHSSEIDSGDWQLFRVDVQGKVTQLPLPPRCVPVTRVPSL